MLCPPSELELSELAWRRTMEEDGDELPELELCRLKFGPVGDGLPRGVLSEAGRSVGMGGGALGRGLTSGMGRKI